MTDRTVRPAPRSRADRRRGTEHRLKNDVDVWVASASASFGWAGAPRDVTTIEGEVEGVELDALRKGAT